MKTHLSKIQHIIKQVNWKIKTLCLFAFIVGFWFSLPMQNPVPQDFSTLIFDKNHMLLRATLNSSDQYCFSEKQTELPEKYKTTLLLYEDRRFYTHIGIDFFSLFKSFLVNIKAKDRIRGGSTIPMQVIRMSHPRNRTYINKLYECLLAIKLSLHYSKSDILEMYATLVPMGGNIIGIQAAAYQYLGKSVTELTWAESALWVILPNSPSQLNLNKNREKLLKKRNQLIDRLYQNQSIDKSTWQLALLENLPKTQRALPFYAPHFCEFLLKYHPQETICHTTLDLNIQQRAEYLANLQHIHLRSLGIQNYSIIIIDNQSHKIRSYIGSNNFLDNNNSGQVDGVQAFRSTGSLLKPFLAAKALDKGPWTMQSLIQDIPTYYGTFVPQNASKQFHGLVSLEEALIKSLNVPFVRLLNTYGLEEFYDFLKECDLKKLFRTAHAYGLPIILGGAEASLWELSHIYHAMANEGIHIKLQYLQNSLPKKSTKIFSAGAAWLVLNSMQKLNRPGSEYYWQHFDSNIPVAWKTGTSYGQKDGWAIGVNPQWTIGVWIGNFDGEGNAALSGAKSAAPLLFKLFREFTDTDSLTWFPEPEEDLIAIPCCKKSGYPVGRNCPDTLYIKHPLNTSSHRSCPYHKSYFIDKITKRSVCSLCWDPSNIRKEIRFIVPAVVQEILSLNGIKTDQIPKHASHCPLMQDKKRMEIVYPRNGIKIFLPRDLDGSYEKLIMSVKHQQKDTQLFWFLNDKYIGDTIKSHEMALHLETGIYHLVVQDEAGFSQSVRFEVFKK